MCSSCSGDYENPGMTVPDSEHYLAAVQRGRILCACQRWFESQEEFSHHLIENCPHTDSVRWSPLRDEFVCLQCGIGVDQPELSETLGPQPDQNIAIKL
jgi:hypothetical protein